MDHGSRLRNFAERPCLPRDALTISSGDHGGLDERVFLLVIDPHQANNLIHPWDHQCLEGSQSMPTSDGHVLPTFIRALSARQRSGTLSRPSKSHFQHAGIRNPVAFSAVFRSPIRYNVTPAPHHQSSTRTSEAFPYVSRHNAHRSTARDRTKSATYQRCTSSKLPHESTAM
jgi:hypothetical protein